MAKKKTMPLNEAIQEVLATADDNPLRGLLEIICQQALEVEISDHLGAEPYERTSERTGYRNGFKPRTLTTAVGDLNLLVPQDRDGTFSTQMFERYQRSDKALVLALMEMYVKGVSTRKVAAITEKLCGKSFSSQLVSKLARDLDASVEHNAPREDRPQEVYTVLGDSPVKHSRDNYAGGENSPHDGREPQAPESPVVPECTSEMASEARPPKRLDPSVRCHRFDALSEEDRKVKQNHEQGRCCAPAGQLQDEVRCGLLRIAAQRRH